MKDAAIKHLREKNLRMEILLGEIIMQYGDRPTHMDGLFKPEFQPELIQRAMRLQRICNQKGCCNISMGMPEMWDCSILEGGEMIKFHHILQRDQPIISCDIDMERYFIAGEEVTQEEIITALAETFDNERTRQDIQDKMSYLQDEMERNGMSDREIKRSWPNQQRI